jgi:hypothetical protein
MLRKSVIFLFIVNLALGLGGCVPVVLVAAGGAGTAAWMSQKVSQEINAPLGRTCEATEYALKSMKYEIVKRAQTRDSAQFTAKYLDGKTIWIDIRKMEDKRSSIEIRVGAVSDKDAARRIMDEITKRLS